MKGRYVWQMHVHEHFRVSPRLLSHSPSALLPQSSPLSRPFPAVYLFRCYWIHVLMISALIDVVTSLEVVAQADVEPNITSLFLENTLKTILSVCSAVLRSSRRQMENFGVLF